MEDEKKHRGRPQGSVTYTSQLSGKPIGVFEWRKEQSLIKSEHLKKLREGKHSLSTLKEEQKNKLSSFLKENNINIDASLIEKYVISKFSNEKHLKLIHELHTICHNIIRATNTQNYNMLNHRFCRKQKIEQIFKISVEDYDKIVSQCFLCGFNLYPCDLHHVDGKKSNNSLNNLVGLCKNCHSGIHYKKKEYLQLLTKKLGETNNGIHDK